MRFDSGFGMCKITTTFGWEYLVFVNEISDYRGGSLSGKYWVNGEEFEAGCFPLCEVQKIEKCS